MHRHAHRVLKADPVMAALIGAAGACRIDERQPLSPFHALAQAIAHQQLNGIVAERILARLLALFDASQFPSPQQLLEVPDEKLRAVGFSAAKVAALKDLAQKTLEGVVPEAQELELLTDLAIVERLTRVRGIGRWTVEMLLMFHLKRRDVLPVDDFGVRNGFRLAYGLKALPTPRALAQFGERWAPYRSIAAWYLWRAVELSRSGRLPQCARPPRVAMVKAADQSKRARPKRARPARKPRARRRA